MKKYVAMLFVAFAFLAGNVQANTSTTIPLINDQNYGVGQGDLELSFSMTPQFYSVSGNSSNSFSFNIGGNYFISEIFAPGVDLSINASSGYSYVSFLPNVQATCLCQPIAV
ncbi:MAG: hypothetical protein R3A11_02205 [Bdellovibrionota bacterium]